ncbi:MAG: hypothetical protein AAFR19_15420, partial [Pseudomonadota bacterium]
QGGGNAVCRGVHAGPIIASAARLQRWCLTRRAPHMDTLFTPVFLGSRLEEARWLTGDGF